MRIEGKSVLEVCPEEKQQRKNIMNNVSYRWFGRRRGVCRWVRCLEDSIVCFVFEKFKCYVKIGRSVYKLIVKIYYELTKRCKKLIFCLLVKFKLFIWELTKNVNLYKIKDWTLEGQLSRLEIGVRSIPDCLMRSGRLSCNFKELYGYSL